MPSLVAREFYPRRKSGARAEASVHVSEPTDSNPRETKAVVSRGYTPDPLNFDCRVLRDTRRSPALAALHTFESSEYAFCVADLETSIAA
jgi:hypothetical protein